VPSKFKQPAKGSCLDFKDTLYHLTPWQSSYELV